MLHGTSWLPPADLPGALIFKLAPHDCGVWSAAAPHVPMHQMVFICSSVSRCCKASLSSSSDDIQANINHGSVCRYGATATCVCPVASGVKVGPHAIVIDTVPTLGCVLHGLWPWWPKGKLNVYSHMVGPRASSTITQ